MLTMIIADDEPFIRRSLIHGFKWQEEFGLEVIGEAADGEEAYELCMKHTPDILFTDIMMPFLNGLQVAEKLKAAGCLTKIIIISGAQDFSYAQSAMKVNAEGYILKPVKLGEVKDIFHKVIARIHHERDNQLNLNQLKKQLHDNMPLIREKFLQNLIAGLYRNEGEIWEKVDYFTLPFKRNDPLSVGVLQLDDYGAAVDKFTEEYKQLLYFSIQNIMSECLNSHPCGIGFVASENEFIMIFCPGRSLHQTPSQASASRLSPVSKSICVLTPRLVSAEPVGSPDKSRTPIKMRWPRWLTNFIPAMLPFSISRIFSRIRKRCRALFL